MLKNLKWILLCSLILIYCYKNVDSAYTIYLQVYSAEVSGSSMENYLLLQGHKGQSPEVIINTDDKGVVYKDLLSRDAFVSIQNKFPADYGVIESVTLGNRGDSLLISFLGIFDATRALWSNITLDGRREGNIEINKSAKYNFPVDGIYSLWGTWSDCSKSCGNGTRTRLRLCNDPTPTNGGKDCVGNSQDSELCNTNACPIDGAWGEWGNWSACSVTCGTNGKKNRTRSCIFADPFNKGKDCPAGGDSETITCTDLPSCAVNGTWCAWSEWSSCSATCNRNATKIRSRECNCPAPLNGGANCPSGNSKESLPCNENIDCPIDGNWTLWSEWSQCSKSCGSGSQSRNRSCTNPAPSLLGKNCIGEPSEQRNCNENPCPVNGKWTTWSDWTSCSVTCGNGTITRSRSCTDPPPSHGGLQCSGFANEVKICYSGISNCPVHGNWSQWTDWSSCSQTCGMGTRYRSRKCDSPLPKFNGRMCDGCVSLINGTCELTDTQFQNCTTAKCLNMEDFTKSILDKALSQLNNTGNSSLSDKDTMKIAFEVVNKVKNALFNELKSSNSSEPVLVDTPEVSVGLAKLDRSNLPSLSSPSKGGIKILRLPDKIFVSTTTTSTARPSQITSTLASTTTQTIAEFSALQSSSFFRSKSAADSSGAMLSLKLSSLSPKAQVPVEVTVPNQNKQTISDIMQPVKFNKTGKLRQDLMYESDKTVFIVSMNLANATNFTIWFTRSNIAPNTSFDVDRIIEIYNNKTLNSYTSTGSDLNVVVNWVESSSHLEIRIPSKQVKANSNLTLYMFTSSTNYTDALLNFQLGVTSMTPREWNFDLEVWQDSDVDLADTSDVSNVNFKSNFLGTFSAKIFIPPNTINFKDIFANFAGKLAESFVVLIVLILLLLSYFIVAIICWRKDRHEATLLRYEPLLDNDSDHEYSFIVSVFTSPCRDAGTTSDIFVNILGKWGSSGHRKINDGYRSDLFSTGSVCNFVMTTESSLGELMALRVWHNNVGRSPSWNLEKILIEDLQTKKMYIFMCDTWLGEDKFDGKTERVLVEIKRDQSFQNLFYRMKVGGVMDKHVLLSLTRKTGVSNYTRLQKLSVLVTMFFLIMVTNAMFHGKDTDLPAEANFKFDLGIISLTWFEIYTGMISVAITYPAIFLAAEIFRRTKRWRRRWTEDEEDRMKKHMKLPRGFLVVGWLILFAGLAASAFFTFFYSLEWGGEKSNNWLKSFFLGIIGMVMLTDPIILLFVYILAKKIFGAVSYDNEMNIDEFVNEDVKQMLGAELKETDKEKLEKIRLEKENDQKISTTVQDALSYMVYLLLLTALAYDARDQVTFRQNDMLKKQFIDSSLNMETYNDVYNYVENMLDKVYPKELYNGDKLTGDLVQSIGLCDCMRQGPFRLRQIRVKRDTCSVFKTITERYGKIPCNENYNVLSGEHNNYTIEWKDASTSISFNSTNFNRSYLSPPEAVIDAFRYQNHIESGGFPFEGIFGYYEGGGYIGTLGMKRSQAEYVVRNLRNKKWIDKMTRAVFFEGTIYNWNSNLFTSIQVLFEVPNSGGTYLFNYGVRSYRLYDYTPGKMIVLLTMQCAYLLVVVINIYRETKKLIKLKKEYFADKWNHLELISIMLAVCIIITSAVRITLTIDSITKLNRNKGFYVAFDNVSSWVEITCIFMAVSSFLAILRCLKYLGFNRHVAIMQATIVRSVQQLSSFGVVLVCFMIAYLCCGHILFCLTNQLFSDVLTMARTLFGAFLGIIPFNQMFETTPRIDSIFYYYTWTSLSVFFLMSIFVSILNDSYAQVVEEELYYYDKELVEHMWNKFNTMWSDWTNSLKQSVPDVLKKKAIAPVDMDDADIQMSSRDNLKIFSKARINPSLRRKLAELNGDKLNKEELDNAMKLANQRNNNRDQDEQVYVSPISFTDIQIAASGSQLFESNMRNMSHKMDTGRPDKTNPRQRQHMKK